MIPFNRLGFIFKLFASFIYPARARKDLADIITPMKTGAAVLDIGSGTGILTQFVHGVREDFVHVCIDPARGMLKYAPVYAYKIEGNAEQLPFCDQAFGVILIGDALHHLNDPLQAIAGMMRCLDGKGTLFIFDIDPGKFMGRFICRLEVLFNEPAQFYEPEELQRLLIGYGFSVKVRNYGWRYAIIASG
ncbi:MAG: SAM-dependent methyltransferase, partial [Syntrophus sp. (in: bacteria)]|nr:SAM-dependent methyltransferase [Syntrophus sp. (in: bacteria)]